MKLSVYKSYDDLPLFLNAKMVAQVLGVTSCSTIPGSPRCVWGAVW